MANGDPVTKVVTQDSRTLRYLEVGDPDGPLVIRNHGGPRSRFLDSDVRDATDGQVNFHARVAANVLRVGIVIRVGRDSLITCTDEYFDPADLAPLLDQP